jgi:hypothetical protein
MVNPPSERTARRIPIDSGIEAMVIRASMPSWLRTLRAARIRQPRTTRSEPAKTIRTVSSLSWPRVRIASMSQGVERLPIPRCSSRTMASRNAQVVVWFASPRRSTGP